MDPIADMLTTIRNNMAAGKTEARFAYSKIKTAILDIFVRKNIVKGYKVEANENIKTITVELQSSLKPYHLRKVSKPGRKVYVKSKDIKSPLSGLGFLVISTPKGVITGSEAKKTGTGGEVICEVW